jgi:group I intron endonuclease
MIKISGIYMIKNKLNNKCYIGSSINIYNRWKGHIKQLKRNKHNKYFQNAWNKYGEENFEFIIIEVVKNLNKLIVKEQYWMDYYKCYNRKFGYNAKPNAKNMLGFKFSEESKLKMGESKLGNKNALGSKGRIYTEEQLKEYSESRKGDKNPMYGTHHTEEWKKENSKRMKGNQHLKGHKHTGEKLLKFQKSEEWCRNKSIERKLWWENKKKQVI